MKKKTLSKSVHWLKDAALKALVVLLLVTAGFYTYAAINWPAADPNDVSGIVGKFVGDSVDTSRSGNLGTFEAAIDYAQANDYCSTNTDSNITGSHVCTPDEMINSYNHGAPGVSPIFTYCPGGAACPAGNSATLWINNGPPAFTANANDCKGWLETSSPASNPNYGTVWNFQTSSGGLLPCRTSKAYACCR